MTPSTAPTSPVAWAATRVRITRKGPRAAGCRAWRTRSWIKIHCEAQTTSASLVGGSFLVEPIFSYQGIGYVLNVDEMPPLEMPSDGAEVGEASAVPGNAG